MESRWINARKRTLDPQAQLAGSVPNDSALLCEPQMLQMKGIACDIATDPQVYSLRQVGSQFGKVPLSSWLLTIDRPAEYI